MPMWFYCGVGSIAAAEIQPLVYVRERNHAVGRVSIRDNSQRDHLAPSFNRSKVPGRTVE
jgi:hypothetical protein